MRKFAAHGYAALCPNLYSREAPGADPDDAAATVRAAGGVPDERLVGDVDGAARYLQLPGRRQRQDRRDRPLLRRPAGVPGRVLAARSTPRWTATARSSSTSPRRACPPAMKPMLGLAPQLSCPLLGLFGAEDGYPAPEETAQLSAELDRLGKAHEFHTYDGAGHAFFAVDRPTYRPEAAVDGWEQDLRLLRPPPGRLRGIPCARTVTEKIGIEGSGKGAQGWIALSEATVYVDHPVAHAVRAHGQHRLHQPGAGPVGPGGGGADRGGRARAGRRDPSGARRGAARPRLRGHPVTRARQERFCGHGS